MPYIIGASEVIGYRVRCGEEMLCSSPDTRSAPLAPYAGFALDAALAAPRLSPWLIHSTLSHHQQLLRLYRALQRFFLQALARCVAPASFMA